MRVIVLVSSETIPIQLVHLDVLIYSEAHSEAEEIDSYNKGLHLTIDSERVWHAIHETAQWGTIPGGNGMSRVALSDADKQVRDYFISEASSLGCSTNIDQMGNIFAILPGENNNIPPIGMGSHFDTQPKGKPRSLTSRYDTENLSRGPIRWYPRCTRCFRSFEDSQGFWNQDIRTTGCH